MKEKGRTKQGQKNKRNYPMTTKRMTEEELKDKIEELVSLLFEKETKDENSGNGGNIKKL